MRLKNHTIPPSAASRLTSLNKSFHFPFFFFLGCFFFENSRRSWLRKIDRRSPEESGVFLGGVGKEEEVDEAGEELGEVAVAKGVAMAAGIMGEGSGEEPEGGAGAREASGDEDEEAGLGDEPGDAVVEEAAEVGAVGEGEEGGEPVLDEGQGVEAADQQHQGGPQQRGVRGQVQGRQELPAHQLDDDACERVERHRRVEHSAEGLGCGREEAAADQSGQAEEACRAEQSEADGGVVDEGRVGEGEVVWDVAQKKEVVAEREEK